MSKPPLANFGSGPPEPDNAERLAFVIAELKLGHTIAGLTISQAVSRALLGSTIVHDAVLPCGLTGVSLKLYEVSFGTGGAWAFLSPAVV